MKTGFHRSSFSGQCSGIKSPKPFPPAQGSSGLNTFLSNFTSVTFAFSFIKIHLLRFIYKLPEGFFLCLLLSLFMFLEGEGGNKKQGRKVK